MLKAICHAANSSAGGIDHFSPDDFPLLSDSTCAWLAEVLNAIEDGAKWPKDLTHGRAAFLATDANSDNPLNYRAILILPVMYRRWATLRLQSLQG